ncbi:hypothetical protein TNCV_5009381 [Trichonephila clavipes]|nr:hypothetical protein TNCV_5009381 [Trichonephila clavipes]
MRTETVETFELVKVKQKLLDIRVEETATHIGIREAEDWFRPIDLAKECDIYISSRSGSHKEIPITYGYTQDPFKNKSQNFKTKIKENYPQYHERENKIALYKVIHLIAQETITKLKLSIVREKCSDIVLCKKANGAMKTSSVEFISRSPNPLPMKSKHHRFSSGLHGNTAADSVRSRMAVVACSQKHTSLRAQAHLMRTETVETFELVKVKQKLLDIRVEEREKQRRKNARGARAGVTF